jgi:hypothetical protein
MGGVSGLAKIHEKQSAPVGKLTLWLRVRKSGDAVGTAGFEKPRF